MAFESSPLRGSQGFLLYLRTLLPTAAKSADTQAQVRDPRSHLQQLCCLWQQSYADIPIERLSQRV
jgi:hypothetical protein